MSEVKFKIIKKHVFCDLDDTVTDQLILSTSKSNYTLKHAKEKAEAFNQGINSEKVFHYMQVDETSEPEKVFYERTYYTFRPSEE